MKKLMKQHILGITEKFSAVIAIAGSVLIFIIIISGAAMIVFCVRMNKAVQLPPADIIPKVGLYFCFRCL